MSFRDYMRSIGTQQAEIGYSPGELSTVHMPGSNRDATRLSDGNYYKFRDGYPTSQYLGNPGNWHSSTNNPTMPAPTYSYGQQATLGGRDARTGLVDKNNNFLGWGTDEASLRNNNQINNAYQDYQYAQPEREAQRLANEQQTLRMVQDKAAQRAAQQSSLPRFGGVGLTGLMGQQQAPQQAPQQGGYARGSGFSPGQQYAGGMGRGAGQGLIGGMGRGGPTGGVV